MKEVVESPGLFTWQTVLSESATGSELCLKLPPSEACTAPADDRYDMPSFPLSL